MSAQSFADKGFSTDQPLDFGRLIRFYILGNEELITRFGL